VIEGAPATATWATWGERRGPRGALALPLGVAVAAAMAAAAPPAALEYRRGAVLGGEVWRLLTGHWVHFSAAHLAWDLLAMLALAWACRDAPRRALLALATASVAIPLAVAMLQPELAIYRGLSGLASTLFVLAACRRLVPRAGSEDVGAARSRRVAALALALFGAKVAWEAATGAALFVDGAAAGFQPVPLAHLVGGLCGALASLENRRLPC
jgi:rhomboid family GlyGly-CTERM serine protease